MAGAVSLPYFAASTSVAFGARCLPPNAWQCSSQASLSTHGGLSDSWPSQTTERSHHHDCIPPWLGIAARILMRCHGIGPACASLTHGLARRAGDTGGDGQIMLDK